MRTHQYLDKEGSLASHTVRVSIIAIILGISLKLPNHRLIDLCIIAMVHDIGMLMLPSKAYLESQTLTEQEKNLIHTHTVLGYNLLKSSDFPPTVSMAVLEHHERENKTGYPQQLSGDKISLFGKIIAVAYSYEAVSSKRHYREAKDSYKVILELLKNEGKQYDDSIIRALVSSLSIYPIGLYVLLSNGKKGQVIDASPEKPRYPVVQIFGDPMPSGKNKTIQTSPDDISVVRPLSPDEIEGKDG